MSRPPAPLRAPAPAPLAPHAEAARPADLTTATDVLKPSEVLIREWAALKNPEDWVAFLRRLIEEKRLPDARRSAEEMKRRFPSSVVPADIQRDISQSDSGR